MGKKRVVHKLSAEEKETLIVAGARCLMKFPHFGMDKAIDVALETVPKQKQQKRDAMLNTWKWVPQAIRDRVDFVKSFQQQTEPEPAPEAADLTYEELLTALISKMANEMMDRTEEIVAETVRRQMEIALHVNNASTAPTPPKRKKKKVIIFGLLASQERYIREDFDTIFDLRFVKAAGAVPTSRIKACETADHVLFLTNFSSHSTEEQIRNLCDYMPVTGGLTEVKNVLSRLWSKQSGT